MAKATKQIIERYGAAWPGDADDLQIEFACIALGGRWTDTNGQQCGIGLFNHLKYAEQLMWPEDDYHRWSDLALQELSQNRITVLMGPGDAGKTYPSAKYALTDYWAAPDETLWLVSSTDVRGLELRVWGAIKDLFNRAKERYDWLPGKPLDSIHTITTDEIDPSGNKARRLTRGIICIPCLQSGRFTGLKNYLGIKQKRLRLLGDEVQLMGSTFLDALPNMMGKPDFKAGLMGNPIDPDDQLGIAAEPQGGWESHPEPTKTTVWDTRFLGGRCINFVGTDSPNFDYPQDEAPRFPYMINQRKLSEVEAFWGKDSQAYYSQCIGVMKTGLQSRRVITKQLCEQHHAFDRAEWLTTERTRVYAVDAAYGGQGGDRCVGGWAEFGSDINGVQILRINPPVIVPVSIRKPEKPEDQIAVFVQHDSDVAGVPVGNIGYDSTGRGTLGSAFARVFGATTPVPVEFGGRPSTRPVRHDLFVSDDGEQRHKTCREHFFDFVSELWFMVRYVIECNQLRELPMEVMREGSQREWGTCGGNKIFVESKHDPKARERMRRSPDLFDWLVTIVEMARQRGFQVRRLGAKLIENEEPDWLEQEAQRYEKTIQQALLTH